MSHLTDPDVARISRELCSGQVDEALWCVFRCQAGSRDPDRRCAQADGQPMNLFWAEVANEMLLALDIDLISSVGSNVDFEAVPVSPE